jgi:hypothetical protein
MKGVIRFLRKIFGIIEKLKSKLVPIAVNVVEAIKKAIDSGTVDIMKDIAIALLPDAGDLIIERAVSYVKKNIPSLCLQLQIIDVSDTANGDVDVLNLALSKLKETQGEKWDEFMSGMAGKLVEYLSDGKIDWKEAKELSSDFYNEYIKQD